MQVYSLMKETYNWLQQNLTRSLVPVATVTGILLGTGLSIGTANAQHERINPETKKCYILQPMHGYHLVSLYNSGTTEFLCLELSNVDLSGKQLPGIQLLFSNLKDANLEGTILNEASFRGSDLSGANLDSAEIREGYFWGTIMRRTNLNSSKLDGATFAGAVYEDTKITNASLNGAYFAGDISGIDFTGTDLSNVEFEDATIEDFLPNKVENEQTPVCKISMLK